MNYIKPKSNTIYNQKPPYESPRKKCLSLFSIMSDNVKKQHWLPCCYLQFFSITGNPDGRNTEVYWTDGKQSEIASVNHLGVSNYTYSKSNPGIDVIFHDVEKDYPHMIRKIISDQDLTQKENYILIFTIFDFHLRNIAYKNKQEVEYFNLYQEMSRLFNLHYFLDRPEDGTDMKKMLDHLKSYWSIKFIKADTHEKFISSDNPVLVFTEPQQSKLAIVFLPISPDIFAIVYDLRILRLTSNIMTEDALSVFNGLQVNHCVRHVYSSYDLMSDHDSWGRLVNLMDREKPDRMVDDNSWKPGFISIAEPVFDRFTFIERLLD